MWGALRSSTAALLQAADECDDKAVNLESRFVSRSHDDSETGSACYLVHGPFLQLVTVSVLKDKQKTLNLINMY